MSHMSPPDTALAVHDLRKSYGSFEAVRGISFDVARGDAEPAAMKSAADAVKASARIAAGELTPGEAVHLAGFIETYVKALETTELEARLRKLEAAAEEGDL